MPRAVNCSSCHAAVNIPDYLAGKKVKCPMCATVFTAPETGYSAQAMAETSTRRTDGHDRRRWEEEEDYEDEDFRLRRRRGFNRSRAASRVTGPGIMLQVYGGLLVLVGLGLMPLMAAMVAGTKITDDDLIPMTIVFGMGTVLGLVAGCVIFWGGTRMKALRSYGWAMAATVLVLVIGFLTCIPAGLIGIWPMIVLNDAEVKDAFSRRADRFTEDYEGDAY